mmetsp:Transcript_28259/g.51090  ORF Transcript_28259/g.51090 Transcript_28259/m.51090 type:complete len:106 (-) Transcript_28259:388-705(-)
MVDGQIIGATSGCALHYAPNHLLYQLLAHFTFLLAISSSSSSLANASTAKIANTGEQAKITLVAVQAYSSANSNVTGSFAFTVMMGRSNIVIPSWTAGIIGLVAQ